MNIEILGSGALGRYLAFYLAEDHNINLKSVRTYDITPYVINHSHKVVDEKRQLEKTNLVPDLRLYASTLMNLEKLRDNTIPTIVLSNGSIFLRAVKNQYTGCILYLSANCSEPKYSFNYNSLKGKKPNLVSTYPLDIATSGYIAMVHDSSGVLQLEKSLRTLLYSRLAGKSGLMFLKNKENRELVLKYVNELAMYYPKPEIFKKRSIETLNNLPSAYIPTIARENEASRSESLLIENLFNNWKKMAQTC